MKFRHIIAGVVFLAFLQGGALWAGPPAQPPDVPSTCDAGFYNVMSNRAWMEGKREMEAAQKLILKPDSVLEYSCFSTMYVLPALVSAPLGTYLSSNFSHKFAGNRITVDVSDVCDVMFQVWDFLKCQNFDEEDFKSFSAWAAHDPRTQPRACNDPGRVPAWQAAYNTSNPNPATPPQLGGVARVKSYLQALNPEHCRTVGPISTGVLVKDRSQSGGGYYREGICLPGCYHRPDLSGQGAGRCVATP